MIIHHAQGHDPGALCLFVNMSQEPIHLQCVIANVDGANGFVRHYVTDYRRITPDDRYVKTKLRQGPIQPGGYLTLGSFEDIILGRQSEAKDTEDATDSYAGLRKVDSLQICVAVKHGPSKWRPETIPC